MKIKEVLLVLVISAFVFLLGFNYKSTAEPNLYYHVYLEEKLLGTIRSKESLEKYINKKGNDIKKQFQVEHVYIPNGLEIKKVNTYSGHVDSVKSIYEKISKLESFTIRGYKLTMKLEDKTEIIYVTEKDMIKEALTSAIETFVGKERYQEYIEGTQTPITTTGSIIQNIYIENDMTIKEENISVKEKIYTSASDLSKYLLFGTTEPQKKYQVKFGDTIEQVAFDNQISVEEFLISNTEFTNSTNLLFPGQEVVIGVLDPKVNVVVEENVVKDTVSKFKTIEKVDNTMLIGDRRVDQEGEDGLIRVTQNTKTVNGVINFVEPLGTVELKATVDRIITKGGRYVPSIAGSVWTWPTNPGYTISSGYEYRINPFSGLRELHTGLDISGTGYGSPVYAANNGVIEVAGWHYSYGNYIIINHNNGYYTLYGHMSRLQATTIGMTVEAGTIIGYVGMTGDATGPHLHFEVWYGYPWRGTLINPWRLF